MVTYILADNQELTRYALEKLILSEEDTIALTATNNNELVKLLTEHETAVVLLDYTLFDFLDENQLLVVSERFPLSRWVLISEELTTPFLRRVIYSSQQFSVVFKDGQLHEITETLRAVAHYERHICQRALEVLLMRAPVEEKPQVLTQSEREIVKAIALGKTTKEIAAERFSSVHTITTHRKNIFRKLGVNTAYEVTKYAIRTGMIDTSEFNI